MDRIKNSISNIYYIPSLFILITTFLLFLNIKKEKITYDNILDEQYVVIISIDGFPAKALWDERIPIPAIRNLAEEGVWAEAMIPSTPTVTWPNHTSLVTGVHPEKHGMLTNGRFIRSSQGLSREMDYDRDELSTYPTLYDYAYEAGMRTAEVNWPVTRNAESLHYSFPDAVDEVTHTTPELREELISRGILEDETNESFSGLGSVTRDYIWTSTAVHIIENHRPNVLLFHLLNVDGTHHAHGAGTRPGFTALAYADSQVKRIIDSLEESGIKDQTTLFIVSDHGFMNVTHSVHPNRLLRRHGLIEVNDEGSILNARVETISNGGTAMVFANNPETKSEDIEKAYSILSNADGISKVVKPEEYDKYGLPQPEDNDNMGHLILNADQNHSFGNSVSDDHHIDELDTVRGTHGYLNDVPEMETLFIASGYGIRQGMQLDIVDNRSIAPTAAHLLDLEMETADGSILKSILIDNN